MKQFIILAFALLLSLPALRAQNFSRIDDLVGQSKFNEAYQEILKFEAKDKNGKLPSKAEYHYAKGLVLYKAGLAKQALDGVDTAQDYVALGLASLQKAREINKDLPAFLLNTKGPYTQFYDIYAHYYQGGIDAFNEKKYAKAKPLYEQAKRVSSYIHQHSMGLSELDTNLIYLDALNNLQFGDMVEVVPSLSKLLKAKFKMSDMPELIQVGAAKAMNSKDKASFDALIQLGEEYFPEKTAELWSAFKEEHALAATTDPLEKLAAYEKMIFEQKTASDRLTYNYVVECYQFLSDKTKPPTKEQSQKILDNMRLAANPIFDKDPKSYYMTLYLYEVSYSVFIEGLNKAIADVQKQVAEKAQKVNGNVVKGSSVEKQINALKSKIKVQRDEVAKLAPTALPTADKLIAYLESILPTTTDKNAKTQLVTVLDIAASFADYAKLNDKADAYDKKRTMIVSGKSK